MGADLYIRPLQIPDAVIGMNEVYPGYFRDSYNPSSVLWQYDLSWWLDVAVYVDDNGHMSPANAREFLGLLVARDDIFRANIAKTDVFPEDTREEIQKHFRLRSEALRDFLQKAIDLNMPILCSI